MFRLHSKAVSHCVSALAAGAWGLPRAAAGMALPRQGERGLEEHCASCLEGKEFQGSAEVWRLPGIWDWTEKSRTEIKRKSHQVTKEVQHFQLEM